MWEFLDSGLCPYCNSYLNDGEIIDTDSHGDELEVKVLTECAKCEKQFTHWERYRLVEAYGYTERN